MFEILRLQKRRFYQLLFLTLLFPFFLVGKNTEPSIPIVLVSVAPHKYFVERIAGDTVSVNLLVPAGSSAHTFEPTPKQMLQASRADLWFLIGESFESHALAALKSHHPEIEAVDLRKGLNLISSEDHGHCHHHGCCHSIGGMDLHFWLSARLAKQQARTIADALSRRYPENRHRYQESLEKFLVDLDALDREITETLLPLKDRLIFVSHPAYAYFCRDYDLRQLSIEFEGKDPTPQQLTKVLQTARQHQIKRIFIQRQYNNKGAQLVAAELGAQLVMLDPYSEDYMNTMKHIAVSFAEN